MRKKTLNLRTKRVPNKHFRIQGTQMIVSTILKTLVIVEPCINTFKLSSFARTTLSIKISKSEFEDSDETLSFLGETSF